MPPSQIKNKRTKPNAKGLLLGTLWLAGAGVAVAAVLCAPRHYVLTRHSRCRHNNTGAATAAEIINIIFANSSHSQVNGHVRVGMHRATITFGQIFSISHSKEFDLYAYCILRAGERTRETNQKHHIFSIIQRKC